MLDWLTNAGKAVLTFGAASLLVVGAVLFLGLLIAGRRAHAFTGIVLLNAITGKLWRSHGPGWFLKIPFLEEVAAEVSLLKMSGSFEDEFETQNKESVSMTIGFEYQPWYKWLVNFVSFGGMQGGCVSVEQCFPKIEEDVKRRLNGIADIVAMRYTNSKDLLGNLRTVAQEIKELFETTLDEEGKLTLQQYYGINLLAVVLSKPSLSPELKKTIDEREAEKERQKIRAIVQGKLKTLALAKIAAAKKMYPDNPETWPTYKQAEEMVLIAESKVEKRINVLKVEREGATGGDSGKDLSLQELLMLKMLNEGKNDGKRVRK